MDDLTFVSNIVSSIAWPAVTVIGLYIFRSPVAKLIPSMEKLKFRDLEASFKSLSVSGQSLLFLDGVARKDQWTFYRAKRAEERELGQAFSLLVADLIKVEKNQLLEKLRSWLASPEENLVWFASEVIGYFQIRELEANLSGLYPTDIHQPWSPHQLNCMWAYARCGDMQDLDHVLLHTRNEHNQNWLLFVYKQMPVEKHATADECSATLGRFRNRNDISEEVRKNADQAIEGLKAHDIALNSSQK